MLDNYLPNHFHMDDTQRDTYLGWLRDAHAMELGLVTTLEKQAQDLEGTPQQARIMEHLEETRGHAEKVEACIERLGGEVSTAKDVTSKMGAALAGMAAAFSGDALVKHIHSTYAAEHFEIASYLTIQAAAETLDDPDTAQVCEAILADELRMAEWAY